MRRRALWIVAVVAVVAAGAVVDACGGPWRRPLLAPAHPDPRSWSNGDLTLAYVGHASVLIDFAGTRILTDPTLFPRYHRRLEDKVGPFPFRLAETPLFVNPQAML